MSNTETVPDQDDLRQLGEQVRKRLAADPGVYRVDTDIAELFAVGDFLSQAECERLCAMVDQTARPS